MIRLYPEEVEAASLERLSRMHVTLEGHVSHTGLVGLDAVGEYAELSDLDHPPRPPVPRHPRRHPAAQ